MGLRMLTGTGLLFVLAFLSNQGPVSSKTFKLPDAFLRCKLDDPNFDACFKTAIEKAFSIMKNGIPSLKLLPVDPMLIERAIIEQGANKPVNLKFVITDSLLTGIGTSEVKTAKANLKDRVFDVDLYTPITTLSGNYELEGKFSLLPLNGKGKFHMALVGHKTNLKMKADQITKDGEMYWDVKSTDILVTEPKNFTVNFENLFNGNKVLGDSTNKALNDNWQGFWEELRPSLEATVSQVFAQTANVIFSKVPEKNLF